MQRPGRVPPHAAWIRSTRPEEVSTVPFIWPLNATSTPDEMNTSYGPRIDADRWDFHDGIDLPAAVGTPVHAMLEGTVHSAGPADRTGAGRGFGSTHVLIQVRDPMEGQNDLYLVYLHLDSVAEAITPGATVRQGDLIGTVGQEDATYPHLHFEFRKGSAKQDDSVHPLRYLPYDNTANVARFVWTAAISPASAPPVGGRCGWVSPSRTAARAMCRGLMWN
jgi:murein DD-endopeptidase MepM/ murein hydrolase activator NlpD